MNKIFIFLLISLNCFSQEKINYKNSDGLLDITPYISYLADSTEKLTFEQIKALPDSAFKANNKVGLDLGSTNYPFWFKIDFDESSHNDDLYLFIGVFARLLDVYVIDSLDKVVAYKSGFLRPIGGSYFQTYRNISNLKQPKTVYFRLESNSMHTDALVGNIKAIYNNAHQFDLFYGSVVAIIFALAFYNLFLYFSLKDSIFLYYSLMTFSIGYINLRYHGLIHELFHTTFPLFIPDNLFSMIVVQVFSVLFVTKFLNSKKFAPKLDFALKVILITLSIIVPFDFVENRSLAYNIFYFQSLLLSLIAIVTGIYIWKLGFEPAKYFTVAWFFYLLGVVILYLGLIGIISLNNFWTRNAWQIGNVIEVLLTSFAVAYRFNLFRQEARDAQALVLQRSGENEQLLLAHNQILEEKLLLEEKISNQKPNFKVDDLLERLQSERGKNKKLAVSTIEGVLLLPIPDIIRLEALGSYCNIYLTNNKKIIASKNLAEFEPMLDKSDFLRIHKSHIVNINFIERYIRGEGGMVIMPDGAEVSVSRTMKGELLERLNIQ